MKRHLFADTRHSSQAQKVFSVISALMLVAVAAVALVRFIPVAEAQITYYWATNVYMWDDFGCTGGYTVGAPFGSCNASTVGQGWASVQCISNVQCAGGDPNNCGNIQYTSITCASQCTPNSSCAASTYVGSTCTDSCGNVYAGTLVATCSNGSSGPYPSCPMCTASSACAASTPVGSTCTDSCGNIYAGTMGGTYSEAYYQASYAPAYSEASYAAPACSSPTVSISATPTRVRSGQTSVLKVTASGITGTCTVTGPGVSQTFSASSCSVSGNITTPVITARSNYTVSCDGGAATAKVSVSIPFGILEF